VFALSIMPSACPYRIATTWHAPCGILVVARVCRWHIVARSGFGGATTVRTLPSRRFRASTRQDLIDLVACAARARSAESTTLSSIQTFRKAQSPDDNHQPVFAQACHERSECTFSPRCRPARERNRIAARTMDGAQLSVPSACTCVYKASTFR